MYFLIAEILFAVWTIRYAWFQVPINEAFVNDIPPVNPWSGPFHNRSGEVAVNTAIIIVLAYFAITGLWLSALFLPVIMYCLHRILFDGIIGWKIHEDFYYLGETAKQDLWLRKHFPHGDGGEAKVIVCLVVLIVLNVVKFLVL